MTITLLVIGVGALIGGTICLFLDIKELKKEMEKIKRQSNTKDWSKKLDDKVMRLKL